MTTHGDLDLAVAADHSQVTPGCSTGRSDACNVIAVDRVFERSYLQRALEGLMSRVDGEIRTDDAEINLALLSLLLDFGLFRYASLLRLPSLPAAGRGDLRQLQVEVSDSIHERDKKTTQDGVTRLRVEDLLFEVAHKFLVNRRVDARGYANKVIRALHCLLYTSPSPRDATLSRMPSSA